MASPLVDSQFALFFSLSNYLTGEPVLDRELAFRACDGQVRERG